MTQNYCSFKYCKRGAIAATVFIVYAVIYCLLGQRHLLQRVTHKKGRRKTCSARKSDLYCLFNISRTFARNSWELKGFCIKSMPGSSTP